MKKAALVTGASSELGICVVNTLLKQNYKVYALARDVDKIKIEHGMLRKKVLDLTQEASCRKVIGEIKKKNSNLDLLVNIAGVTVTGETIKFTKEEFEKVLQVNVLGLFNIIKYYVNTPAGNKVKRVINITSMAGIVAFPNFGIYSASKFAQEALGLSLRYELKKDNVLVTNIAPGAIEMLEKKDRSISHKTARRKFTILKYLMPPINPQDVANKIIKVIEMNNSPARVIIGNDAKIVYFLQKTLPFSLFDKLMMYVWTKK